MTVKELKDKLEKYPEDINIYIEISILDSECNEIDTDVIPISKISYINILSTDEYELQLQASYTQEEEDSNE